MKTSTDENGNINCLYCTNCFNCVDCVGCDNCNNCNKCTKCKNCINCRKCMECNHCNECLECINCQSSNNCDHCEGAILKGSVIGYKDYELYDNNHLIFPNKGRCQYSDKIESFFLVQGFIPYNRKPKNTNFIKKSKSEFLSELNYWIDMDEFQILYDSQGVQIAWNYGRLYKRYWVTYGKHRAKFTINDLALFLIMNKLIISEIDIQEFTGKREVPYDLRVFQKEFQGAFGLHDLKCFL